MDCMQGSLMRLAGDALASRASWPACLLQPHLVAGSGSVARRALPAPERQLRGPPGVPAPAGGGPAWKIQHENQHKWANPLIGWTSTADPLDNVARQLYFPSKEDAIAFAGGRRAGRPGARPLGPCLLLPWGASQAAPRPAATTVPAEKQGWDYEVAEYHNPTTQRPKRFVGYGDK